MPDRDIYKDIALRTGGDLYIGVVGPVRTGKSTFIKKFMELLILPMMKEGPEKQRAIDELPLSASGTIVTTSEPKFIPKEAAHIDLGEVNANFRLIDCVGFMVSKADALNQSKQERMVKTPWFDYEVPFSKAAEIGTYKVIHDHSQIGIVITTDASFGEIGREDYVSAEEKTIAELKRINKPFIIVLNSSRPYSDECISMAQELSEKYAVSVLPMNCLQLKKDDIYKILESILYEFPVASLEFYTPGWLDMLDDMHPIKLSLINYTLGLLEKINTVKDLKSINFENDMPFVKNISLRNISLDDGCGKIVYDFDEQYYYEVLSELVGVSIENEYDLIDLIKDFSLQRKEYEKVTSAVNDVRSFGYGVVTPEISEIKIDTPVIIKQGNKYGVKLHASSPSIHMIRADIETEIAPIVGSEAQANDLIEYIKSASESGNIWETNIFGKTIEQLVNDGMENRVSMLNDESRLKLQDTMKKIVNDINGGMVCIIL